MDFDNRRRALAEIVSLEAWHKGFTTTRKATDLHVDVTFTEGRVGGDPESNVRFKLRLKRAEVVVIVPATEPAIVDRSSVSRDARTLKIQTREKSKSDRKAGSAAELKLGLGADGAKPSTSLRGSFQNSAERQAVMTISESAQAMHVTQRQMVDGAYAWIIEPAAGSVLLGKPWDALQKPRFKLIDTRPDKTKGIPPSIRVELHCLREDLDIIEIQTGDPVWVSLTTDLLGRNKLLAAEALIRTRLAQAGLAVTDLSNPLAPIVLSAVIAEPSV